MTDIIGITTFIRTVELGSQAGAAEELGMTRVAVGRRIRSLEQSLGVQLLQRTTRRQTLTEAGSIFYEQARPALLKLREAGEMVSELRSGMQGTIRINAPISFATRSLGPILTQFSALHPRVLLELVLDDREVDLIGGGFDLVLRIGNMRDSSLISRRLALFPTRICASPAYVDKYGIPEGPEALRRHNCLRYTYSKQTRGWDILDESGKPLTVPVTGNMTANNGDILLSAALCGQGIILQPSFIVDPHIATGQLVELLPGRAVRSLELHALFPPSRLMPGKLRRLIEFLTLKLA